MKKRLLWIAFALATAAQAATLGTGSVAPSDLKPERQEARAAHLAAELLSRYHYKKVPLDEAFSEKIFDSYLKSLDSEKLFFIQADVDRLAADRTRLGAAIMNEDLDAPFAMFGLFRQRAAERVAYARALLKKGFDFQSDESYQYSREKEPWAKSEAEVRELWRKRVKNDWLRLKLAGKDDKSIVEVLDKRYENVGRRMTQLKSNDVLQTFMNAYTTAIEPHTNYLGPRAAANFDISMRLSLSGIGAVLAELNEYTTIRELSPGGPAILSGQLQVGDRIVGVAQGDNGAMTDVTGWRIDDTVALIRGKEDTVVVLDVLPADAGADGKHKRISLVRKTITLADQAAKATVHAIADGGTMRRIGVIALPSFYADLNARQRGVKEFRSATRDVAKLLDQMNREKVDSVLIDLRNNGGGSLAEAIELTGLFIDKGPVVQQKNARGNLVVESDTKAGVAWAGPLGVLINRNSASASEIFAAAIQDYGRGLILGERSFGKGTVQSLINLDQVAGNDKPQLGELKMTVAQFFRINGGTTQLRGVTPDIVFPTDTDSEPFGEASYDNALPWTQVQAADYAAAGDLRAVVPALLPLHEARRRTDQDFRDIEEDITDVKVARAKKTLSLNERARRQELDTQEARRKAREARDAKTAAAEGKGSLAASDPKPATTISLGDDGLQANERDLTKQLAAEKARKDAKDPFLKEAVRILGDELRLANSDATLAARIRTDKAAISD